jgi:hypothetical protein
MAIFTGSIPNPNFIPATLLQLARAPLIQNFSYLAVEPPWSAMARLSREQQTVAELSITIVPLTNTSLNVIFSAPVINNFALLNPLNYIFTPSLSVYTVTPNISVNPTYVTLTVSSMSFINYSLNILTIEEA